MIVAGIGCRRACAAGDIIAAIRTAETAAHCTVDALATPAFKGDEPGILAAAALLRLRLHFIHDDALLLAQPACITRSALAQATTGLASIAEAAALAAVPGGRLILPRITHGHATCALAQKEDLTTESTENTEEVSPTVAGPITPARQQQPACGANLSVSSVVHLAVQEWPTLAEAAPLPGRCS